MAFGGAACSGDAAGPCTRSGVCTPAAQRSAGGAIDLPAKGRASLAACKGYVYFAKADGIYHVAETGGAPEQIVGGTDVIAQLTLVEHTLYSAALTSDRKLGSVDSLTR